LRPCLQVLDRRGADGFIAAALFVAFSGRRTGIHIA
jgi:hypothetical protein